MKKVLVAVAMMGLAVTACSDGPVSPPISDMPGIVTQITATPIALSSHDGHSTLTANLSFVAQDPYDYHSVYYGTGTKNNPIVGAWHDPLTGIATDPIIVDSIMRPAVTTGTSRPVEVQIQVPLRDVDTPGWLCVVSWNDGLFVETCAETVWPTLPGAVSDIIITFGDAPPPWVALTVVPSMFTLSTDGQNHPTTASVLAVLTRASDNGQFVCVTLDNGLRGYIQVDVDNINDINSVYVANDPDWYFDLNCGVAWSSTNPAVASVVPGTGFNIPTRSATASQYVASR